MNRGYIDAVVVVDMQQKFLDYFDSNSRYHLVAMQLQMLDACRKHNVPVVALEYEGSGKTIRIIDEEIRRNKQHDFLRKEDMNGFYNPNLKTTLEGWKVKNICLMGILANDCVKATAKGAMSNHFGIITADDLIGDNIPDAMQSTREWFANNGTYLPSHRDAIGYLAKK